MKFGLFYLFSDFGDIPQDQLFHEVLEEIEYAEELGFDSVWLPEHHFAIYGMLGNPLTLAAAISQRTKRMLIGTAIMVVPFQHPLRLAEDAALVDVLSNGRLLLGVGRGYQPPEFAGFGVAQGDSRAMFLEGVEILTRALKGERFTYDGQFWQIREPTEIFPKPVQKPHPPLYWATVSPGTSEMAARHGASIIRAPQFSDLTTVSQSFIGYKERLREAGYDPDSMDQPLSTRVYVAPTDEEARAELPNLVWFYQLLANLLPGAAGKPIPAGYEQYPRQPEQVANITVDELWERGTCYGSPERVVDMMQRYQQHTGTNHWMTQMRIGGLSHSKAMRSMELFARHVMPALKKQEAGVAAP